MKKQNFTILLLSLFTFLFLNVSCKKESTDDSFSTIEKKFAEVPDKTPLAVYWYWISDNISKEGVINDLHAMKEAGINRAFIGNIGLAGAEDPQRGKIKLFTDEWWEVMHAALKTASELDIEIGIFNSPGWSQSGGPWITPEQSMRYLSSWEYNSTENGKWGAVNQIQMPKSDQDVKVIAYQVPKAPAGSAVFSQKIIDGKTIELIGTKADTVRSITVQMKQEHVYTMAELFVNNGGAWKSLRQFVIDRTNFSEQVGFYPNAPIVISLKPTYGNRFKLVFTDENANSVDHIALSPLPTMERWPEKSLAKMFQRPLPMWGDYMWDAQLGVSGAALMIEPDNVIDISDKLQADGSIVWNAPEGEWTVFRTVMHTTGVRNAPASPEGAGLEVDKMSKEHVRHHFDSFIGKILERIPEKDRRTFRVVVQDSYETGGQNWTDTMLEDFEDRYGYDPVPYIPVLQGMVVGTPDISDRFLWDLRRLVADKVSYEYVAGLREVSHENGLTTWLENYGHWGFPGEFLQYGGQSDEIGGEFWSTGDLGDIENRAASSCGHIYGKKRIWAESFTFAGVPFVNYPYSIKQRGDRFFTEGINATLLHVFIHQPYEDKRPGVNAWFGNDFYRFNTWYKHLDLFANYLKRCNYMLQQGRYVADVAYFIGEDAPKMTGITDPELPIGYQFDYINAEILLGRASVKDGKLLLKSGMEYSVLVLPKQETMRPELLAKIKLMVEQGLTVLGPAPQRSPSMENYPQCDEQVAALAAAMWGVMPEGEKSVSIGEGKIYVDTSLEKIFADMNLLPDFKHESGDLLFVHNTLPGGELYFVSNTKEEYKSEKVTFRVSDKQPELWNPVTGERRALPQFTQADGMTTLTLDLDMIESQFIIFRDKAKQSGNGENFPKGNVVAELNSAWDVTFDGINAPEGTVRFESLTDWKDSADENLKYFSGTANYTQTLQLDKVPAGKVYLSLGKVMVTAKVKINGKYAGGAWTEPYRVLVTGLLEKGENNIEVEVCNNWLNRLVGDLQLPEEERKTWAFVMPNPAQSLQSSGLSGPVELIEF